MQWLISLLQHLPDNLTVDLLLVIALIFMIKKMSELNKTLFKTIEMINQRQMGFADQLHDIIDQQTKLLQYVVHTAIGGDEHEKTNKK